VNVLLVRAGALGDLLLLRRAIFGLKDRGHRVSLMAPAVGRVLLGPGASEVDEVLDWDDPAFLPLFATQATPSQGIAERLGGFSACIAYTDQAHLLGSLERLVRTVIAHSPTPAGVHASEWLARPSLRLGAEASVLPPDMQANASEEAHADRFLRGELPPRFVAIHPGSGSAAKNWPAERFARLALDLSPQPGLLIEGPADAQAVAGFSGSGRFMRARHLPLRVLGAVLRRASLFVGNDSGVTHLAAAWGAPTLALFGPTNPATWAPVGGRVVVARSPSGSMSDLPVSDVWRAAHDLRAED
jgi:heptosyltransferase III